MLLLSCSLLSAAAENGAIELKGLILDNTSSSSQDGGLSTLREEKTSGSPKTRHNALRSPKSLLSPDDASKIQHFSSWIREDVELLEEGNVLAEERIAQEHAKDDMRDKAHRSFDRCFWATVCCVAVAGGALITVSALFPEQIASALTP